jgi:hypothetical protein
VQYQIKFYPLSMGREPEAAYKTVSSALIDAVTGSKHVFTTTLRQTALSNGNLVLVHANSSVIEDLKPFGTPFPTMLPSAEPSALPTFSTLAPTMPPVLAARSILSRTNIIIFCSVVVFFIALACFAYFTFRKRPDTKVIVVKRPSQTRASLDRSSIRRSVSDNTNPLYSAQQQPVLSPVFGGVGYQGPADDRLQEQYPSQADLAYGHAQFQGQAGRGSISAGRSSLSRPSFEGGGRVSFSQDQQAQQILGANRRLSAQGGGGDSPYEL